MKTLKSILALSFTAIFLSSCLGDKKTANVSEIGETSFVNKNFKGNLINYSEGMSACNNISQSAIASLYNVSSDMVHIEDPTKSDRYQKNIPPACVLFIKSGGSDYEWLRGSIAVNREVGKDEYMSDVAEATGNTSNWEEAWSLKKSISSSAEWLPNMGKAALWNPKKALLEIKFEGYTLVVKPLKNMLNKAESAKNRDYKNVRIDIAKAAGFIN